MGLQAKSVIFVAAVCTMLNIVQSKDNDGDSSDDEDSIREALLLIKLMKKAGAKQQIMIPSVLTPERPGSALGIYSFDNIYFQPNRLINAESNYRRKISDDGNTRRIMDQEKNNPKRLYRRQDYDDMFGPHPNETSSKPPLTQSTTVSATPKAHVTTQSKLPLSSPAEVLPAAVEEKTTATIKLSNAMQIAAKANKQKQELLGVSASDNNNDRSNSTNAMDANFTSISIQDNPTEHSQETNPIISQVANELKNEMEFLSGKYKVAKGLSKFTTKSTRVTLYPTTLKIFLETSRKYPIPYPENHAFCYLSPENALCKTPI